MFPWAPLWLSTGLLVLVLGNTSTGRRLISLTHQLQGICFFVSQSILTCPIDHLKKSPIFPHVSA